MRHILRLCPRMFGSAQALMRTHGASTRRYHRRWYQRSQRRCDVTPPLTALAWSGDVAAQRRWSTPRKDPQCLTQFLRPLWSRCLLLRPWMSTSRLRRHGTLHMHLSLGTSRRRQFWVRSTSTSCELHCARCLQCTLHLNLSLRSSRLRQGTCGLRRLGTQHQHLSVSTSRLRQLGTLHPHRSMSALRLRLQRTQCMYAAPSLVVEDITPAPAVSFAAPVPVVGTLRQCLQGTLHLHLVGCMSPAPVGYAAPAPVVEFVCHRNRSVEDLNRDTAIVRILSHCFA